MFILYLDEFGHAGKWLPEDPNHSHHPLFGLAGFAVPAHRWADVDRGFLRLKQTFFKSELKQLGKRPERFEPKRLDPISRRDVSFAMEALKLIRSCDGHVFAHGTNKGVDFPNHSADAIYVTNVQGVIRQFEKYLRHRAGLGVGRGVIVMDRRNDKLNEIVLGAAQVYLFGGSQAHGIQISRLIEIPLLVPSEWYHGVQLADVIGRAVSVTMMARHLNYPKMQKAEPCLGPLLDQSKFSDEAWSTLYLRNI
jgi:Protein of unknown function (DUF3800)